MQLTGTGQEFTTDRLKMPLIFHLIEKVYRQIRYAMRLFGIDHKSTLNVTQRAAANILIHRQMQHAIHQPFAQRSACKRHTLDVQFGENRDQNGQTAGEYQRAFQR
ncbi:Uncharacterised protein [Citrobacter koseri]|uniref:Uncharacterized protein n=1 Tax=Citrobacter koseri TaxID=545 RepID=A0A2X2WRH0_CITKO|nr:Uncharacterised protein [Citrobacter koseri]